MSLADRVGGRCCSGPRSALPTRSSHPAWSLASPSEEDLPARDRQILSLDSGANDGLALPSVLAAVVFAGPMTAGHVAADVLWQVLGAVILGVLGGRAGMACASFRLAQAPTDVSGAPETSLLDFNARQPVAD